ncbi:cytochrome b [Glaesserella sp.]|uniref:cytochrome b n=1 Tax=Glaesserella sp. TaxID=2094731 RepID=UPI0035A0E010
MQADNSQYYGTVSRFLHWLMAICFGFMLFTGLSDEETFKSFIAYHKSVGTILMGLIIIRLIWAIANRHRRPPAKNIFVTLGHKALYGLMVVVPVVALIRQYGAARGPLDVFGMKVMNGSAEKIDWMVSLGNQWHGLLAWVLFTLVAGHIVMAIIHQIKGEKIINRMAGKM